MVIEYRSFKDWGYPFIAQDYEGEFGLKCPDAILGGIVVEETDNIKDLLIAANLLIIHNIPAVMIELAQIEHIEDKNFEDEVIKNFNGLFSDAGYKDLQSYEHRLSYGKLIK